MKDVNEFNLNPARVRVALEISTRVTIFRLCRSNISEVR